MDNWLAIIQEKLMRWWEYLIRMLPNAVLAILAMAFFIVLAKVVQRFTRRVSLRVSKSESITSLLSGIVYSVIIIIGFMTALEILKLEKTVSSILAGAGIIGLALGFAFQDLTSNFISGAFIAFKRPFEVGHTVETNGFIGTIEEIRLRSTTIRTFAGLHVILPNKDIFQRPIINHSLTPERKVELEFHIANTIDLKFIESKIRQALLNDKIDMRDLRIYFSAIEDPRFKIYISFWTKTNTELIEFMQAKHQAILAINKAFIESKIYTIQFPAQAKEPTQQKN
ncbi:MAG TPA: mechanosensitive ion channel family protein [Ohtaekwangia sp.]